MIDNKRIFETEDIDSLAEAMCRSLGSLNNSKINCRLFSEKFNWSKNAKVIEQIYVGEISG